MPNKHVFSKAERWAVWSAYDGDCFWCGEPFDFRLCTIDHVIPESLLNDEVKLARICDLYKLGADFKINDFGNWVPAHQRCNGVKATAVFDPSPAFLFVLVQVKRKERKARAIHHRFVANRRAESIIAALEIALEEKAVPLELVQELVRSTLSNQANQDSVERLEASADNQTDAVLLIGGWQIYERSGDIAYVTRDGRRGYTYVGEESAEGLRCPHCSRLGPWNGIQCLSCGQRSDPWD